MGIWFFSLLILPGPQVHGHGSSDGGRFQPSHRAHPRAGLIPKMVAKEAAILNNGENQDILPSSREQARTGTDQ